jgi:lipid-binding SYLF domain-containing protein
MPTTNDRRLNVLYIVYTVVWQHKNNQPEATNTSKLNIKPTVTMDAPFRSQMASPQPTLRQEAVFRASAEKPQPQTPSHPLSSMSSSTPVQASPEGEDLASSARKEWRLHKSGMTQDLEERRNSRAPGTISVRVLSAETRQDMSDQPYTTYILQITLANTEVLQLEHRYSEFAKLNELFRSHNIQLDTSFPSKHWAGRMGNWTPSLQFAPQQNQELIQFRKIQLDVWLVHIVEKYNLGDLPHSLAKAVYEFLTCRNRPPCEQDNHLPSSGKNHWNNPLSFTLGSTIRQATSTLESMCHFEREELQSIPLDLLGCAKGLCFLTVIKAGLVVSGRVGTGLLIARVGEQQWSAPLALGTLGMGWGMLAGGDITHYLVVLTTMEAVESLVNGTVQLGAELGVAVGPMGRGATSQVAASQTDWAVHPAYSYAHSQGLFAGISLEGSILTVRQDVNAKFYGQHLTPEQVLSLPQPKAAEPLYMALERAMATEIPEGSFRPSTLFQETSSISKTNNKTTTKSPIHDLPTVDPLGRLSVQVTPNKNI